MNLIVSVLETHHIVVADHALVLQTEDGCQVVFSTQWPMGVIAACWRDRETPVEVCDEVALQQGIGRRTRRYPRQASISLTQRSCAVWKKRSSTPLGLRTACQDQLDVQFLQGTTKLGQGVGVAATFALGLEDAVAVGVQGLGRPLRRIQRPSRSMWASTVSPS